MSFVLAMSNGQILITILIVGIIGLVVTSAAAIILWPSDISVSVVVNMRDITKPRVISEAYQTDGTLRSS